MSKDSCFIEVPKVLRDRIKKLAKEDHRTMKAYLELLVPTFVDIDTDESHD